MSVRRVQIQNSDHDQSDDEGGDSQLLHRVKSSDENLREDQEPFMGFKVRRRASLHRDYRGDYIDVPSKSSLIKILDKQGDRKVLFADRILKFTGTGKMKRRTLLITDFAIYIVDPETGLLKRRIALAAVEKLCLSELSDNFFAIIIPTEYDCLMASTRKSEIVTVFVEAIKNAGGDELEVEFSNRSFATKGFIPSFDKSTGANNNLGQRASKVIFFPIREQIIILSTSSMYAGQGGIYGVR